MAVLRAQQNREWRERREEERKKEVRRSWRTSRCSLPRRILASAVASRSAGSRRCSGRN